MLLRVLALAGASFVEALPGLHVLWQRHSSDLPPDPGDRRQLLLGFFQLAPLLVADKWPGPLPPFFLSVLEFQLAHIEPNFAEDAASLWTLLLRRSRMPLPLL